MVDAKVKIPRGAGDGDDPAVRPAPRAPAERRRIELTWPQVVASAAATVAGALLASGLGVYGTVLGAGLISLIATAGGPVFQHLLDRGGRAAEPAPAEPRRAARRRRAGRPRRLRRRLAVALGVFVLAMTAITGIELASGSSFAGWWQQDRGGETSVGDLFGRGGGTPAGDTDSGPADTDPEADPDDPGPGPEERPTAPEEGDGADEAPTGDGPTTPGESPPPTEEDAPPAETDEPTAPPSDQAEPTAPTTPAPSADEPDTPGRNAQPGDGAEEVPAG